ncbi:hypothetical protein BV20DRAFT_562532 [Pilatotrama ljubarskyi]|nr:hypothetical protein BV20DRAFT_562532 [Pilatotrama ljubarskyi]
MALNILESTGTPARPKFCSAPCRLQSSDSLKSSSDDPGPGGRCDRALQPAEQRRPGDSSECNKKQDTRAPHRLRYDVLLPLCRYATSAARLDLSNSLNKWWVVCICPLRLPRCIGRNRILSLLPTSCRCGPARTRVLVTRRLRWTWTREPKDCGGVRACQQGL